MLVFCGIILGLILVYLLVVNFVPSFGGDLSADQRTEFTKLENFADGKFKNRLNVPEKVSLSKFFELSYAFFTTKVANAVPKKPLVPKAIDPSTLRNPTKTQLYWFGHSTFLLQHNSLNILLDPMFGDVPAPLNFLGQKRFTQNLPIEPEDLPYIDYVVYSHDHYDHLDYESVLKLKDKVAWFITPLGLGNHLMRWGVDQKKIIELNWWESKDFENIKFISTPAQHFSGRKFSNNQQTLWSSWVIQSEHLSLYFSGDSGYDVHFKEIGESYGPFDIALVECGQYNKLWSDVHLFPEETVQVGIDLNANFIIPIHWGSFKLAMHAWNEPVKRLVEEARQKNVEIQIPQIGAPIEISKEGLALDPWWIE